ncbi:Crp/Fnr family transcriptional regulator [Cereibacter sphaeroides]|uniref:Crp/Fnr family transcriptional regulator n=1 Tax=Cereibacter sphaeroides TaxID=1063 RepID=UPI000F5215AC|nr:Crp/Fnr family transcriptional regulator [Cereibacter sphaeroides]AZB64656.1 Crp/Fnr family transcriptional regulator [Cereibacter sphaeroides]AZB67409.1 Crp/Fnr family transcriptional regulator [Cereibacter sphaeroides]
MPIELRPLARKLGAFAVLSDDELAVLEALSRRLRVFPPGQDVIHQGQERRSAYILASGWTSSYKLLPDGRRQIVDFQIPGDFLGLRSLLFRTSDHNIMPVTRIEASEVSIQDLVGGFNRAPRLAAAVLWAASRDEAMVVEHLVGVGRRGPRERLAHFFLELHARLRLVGFATATSFDCPLSQYHLADALGLTAIHVNRVLRGFREADLMRFQKGKAEFLDPAELVRLADFDMAYLDQEESLLSGAL